MSKQYNNRSYEVTRVKTNTPGGFAFEIVLTIDGEQVCTATQLETSGVKFDDVPNWTVALELFAKAYIDSEDFDYSVAQVKTL
jgi:hypothetical protein